MAGGRRPGVGIGLGIGQRQTQRLGLSPAVMTGLSVLRMSAGDLAEALAREAEANPFLVPGLPPPMRAIPLALGFGGPSDDGSDRVAASDPDWQEDLLRQIGLMSLPRPVAALAQFLVTELDERGWLDRPLTEIAAETGYPLAALESALTALQGCEPAGVGARSLPECLALQLIAQGMAPAAAHATLAELPRFARRDWPAIAAALGISPDEARQRGAALSRLSPRPIAERDEAAAPVLVLRPDLELIRAADGSVSVALAREHAPRPGIDAALVRRAGADGFGADLLARARAMLRAVERRSDTLVRIGTWLAVRQAAALRDGPGALVAARQLDCAANLGLHPATISRAVAGKALLADGQLWPLSRLFTPAAPGFDTAGPATGAPPPGVAAVARRIAALIAGEDPRHPLSDAALQRKLAAEGVDIARRTVAKYRDGLRLPPAATRRLRD